ncbi:MAG: glycosyltransferase [Janthinobacterium lividum]
MKRVPVVIPAWTEAEAIGPIVAEVLRKAVGKVIVADGGSTDGAPAAARAAGARVIDAGRGYGRTCAEGAAAASPACDIIAFMDGEGAQDFVIALRTCSARAPGSMNWHHVQAAAAAGRLIGVLYGVRYTNMCASRVLPRAVLAQLDMTEMTYGWNIEMQTTVARTRFRVLELPVPYRCRAGGQSKVAGSLRGTLRASTRIASMFARVAASRDATAR